MLPVNRASNREHTQQLKPMPKQKAKRCRAQYRPHVDPSISSQTSHHFSPQPSKSSVRTTRLEEQKGQKHLLCVLQLERPQSEVIPQRSKPRHQRCYCTNDWIICLSPVLLRALLLLHSRVARNVRGKTQAELERALPNNKDVEMVTTQLVSLACLVKHNCLEHKTKANLLLWM